jgi:hypothetical protein
LIFGSLVMPMVFVVLLTAWSPVAATDEPLAPWASNLQPTDVPRRHIQEITEGRTEYVVVQGGTMDGRNCRSPQGHLMDGDMQTIYLLRDNETIAGEQDLVRDHDLIRRTHTQGILQPDRREGDEWESSIYVFEGEVTGDRNSPGDTAMNMTLRPGEALVWRWGHVNPVKYHGGREPKFPDRICGLWEYRLDFTNHSWRDGATLVGGIREEKDGLAVEQGKTGAVIWTMRSPYVFGGKARDRRDRREVRDFLGRPVVGGSRQVLRASATRS